MRGRQDKRQNKRKYNRTSKRKHNGDRDDEAAHGRHSSRHRRSAAVYRMWRRSLRKSDPGERLQPASTGAERIASSRVADLRRVPRSRRPGSQTSADTRTRRRTGNDQTVVFVSFVGVCVLIISIIYGESPTTPWLLITLLGVVQAGILAVIDSAYDFHVMLVICLLCKVQE